MSLLEVIGAVSRWALAAVAVISFFRFVILVGSSSNNASEFAGQGLASTILCGIAAGVWLYGARRKSNKSTAPELSGAARETDSPPRLSSQTSSDHGHTTPAADEPHQSEHAVIAIPDTPAHRTPSEVANSVVELITIAFSYANYLELFGDQSFSSDWTVEDGLAVWYFFAAVALDVAVFTTIDAKEHSTQLRDICDELLSKEWRLSGSVLDRFNSNVEENGETAFFAFIDCGSQGLSSYFSRCVNRILGAQLPFEGQNFNLILAGHQPETLDVALSAKFGKLFTHTTNEAKNLIGEANISWH